MIRVHELAQMIDHTLLKADASTQEFITLCEEAKVYNFKMVAINSAPVKLCSNQLKETDVNVGAAIGFPLGQTTIETKIFEVKNAIKNGADEIDYVINIGELKNKNYKYIEEEMRRIVEISKAKQVTSKVILENCYLTNDEKIKVCEIAKKVKPDYLKTSTGFGIAGATSEDVKLMKRIVGDDIKVKAAGGIRDLETALNMIELGAERIGTSSGVKIIKELQSV